MRPITVPALAVFLTWSTCATASPAALFPATATRAGSSSEVPPLILSEILADPAALTDAQGEFIELGCPRADSVFLESVSVSIDGRVRFLGALGLGPGDCILLCRDSAAYALAGIHCQGGWDGMSLANSRALTADLAWAGGGFHAVLPASRAGISWENTWDGAAGYAEFRASAAALAGGDSATPGGRNSRSARPAARDLALGSLESSPGSVQVTVESRGSAPPSATWLCLRLDADWDGLAERTLDSAWLDASGPYPRTLQLVRPVSARGRLEAVLGPDEDLSDNARSLAQEPEGSPLAFGGFLAAAAGEPEWLEIRNATGSAGSPPRRVESGALALDGAPLGIEGIGLEPGESLILTPDTAAFRVRYGAVKARLARPEHWRALRNSGDTLVLSACGIPADTLAWAAIRKGVPDDAGIGSLPEKEGWALAGRVAFPAAPLDVEVRAPAGRSYVLRAFDLEGQCVREIGRGGPGRRAHAWDGRGEGGRALPRGAYVLALAFEGGPTRKRAVLAGER
jgi:hypothetical protein